MTLSRLNFWTALVSVGASLVWVATGQVATGLVWLVCSGLWLALAFCRLRSPVHEPNPIARLMRRLSRMLIWS